MRDWNTRYRKKYMRQVYSPNIKIGIEEQIEGVCLIFFVLPIAISEEPAIIMILW